MDVQRYDKPFPYWVIDDFREDFLLTPAFEVATSLCYRPEIWKQYDSVLEKKQIVDNPAAVGRFTEAACNYDWLNMLITSGHFPELAFQNLQRDPKSYGGSVHAMMPGDHLGCHLDRELLPESDPPLELRLAVVAFVMVNWQALWGGELCFWDDSARKVVSTIYPSPQRVVVWEPSNVTYHSVHKVRYFAQQPRITVNAFYYAPARPNAVRKRALFVPPRDF